MKKALSLTKVALFCFTLAVLAMGFVPQAADAAPGDITIFCDGSDNLCATYEDSDVIIDFYFGRATAILIEM